MENEEQKDMIENGDLRVRDRKWFFQVLSLLAVFGVSAGLVCAVVVVSYLKFFHAPVVTVHSRDCVSVMEADDSVCPDVHGCLLTDSKKL